MVHYKLYYFNVRNIGEPIRLILHYANQPFEDYRCHSMEEWAKLKPTMPLGQLPVLEEDGKRYADSHAICRHLARKYGLAGKSPFEEALVDAYADWFKDFNFEVAEFLRVLVKIAEGDKEHLQKTIFDPAMKKYMPQLADFLNKSKSGFLMDSGLTWADFFVIDKMY